MAIPKSKKLAAEEAAEQANVAISEPSPPDAPQPNSPKDLIKIREVKCLNDFVAILQFEHEGTIVRPEDSKLKNEGMIVGVGSGAPDGAGGRLPPQVKIGEVVMFSGNPAAVVESQSPPYVGRRVIITSERNLICKLRKPVPFEYYDA